jgi:hypothetical protein
MDQSLVALHQRAVEIAKRILTGTQRERYDLGVRGPTHNSRVFNDLVELAEQLLREEELQRTAGRRAEHT